MKYLLTLALALTGCASNRDGMRGFIEACEDNGGELTYTIYFSSFWKTVSLTCTGADSGIAKEGQ